jgi:hypothetical protein
MEKKKNKYKNYYYPSGFEVLIGLLELYNTCVVTPRKKQMMPEVKKHESIVPKDFHRICG